MDADQIAQKLEDFDLNDSTEETTVDAADERGDDSVKQEGNDSANQKGVDSVDQTRRDSRDHGETGAVAVGEAAAPGLSQDTGPNDQSQNRNIPPTPSDQSTQGARGFETCGNQSCQTCKIALPGVTFTDRDGMQYDIYGTFNCTSQSVVYVICCKNCGKQYVGKSIVPFHETIERKTRVTKQLVYTHFKEGDCGVGDRRCFVIERVSDAVALKERTKQWKNTLNTYQSKGLNER